MTTSCRQLFLIASGLVVACQHQPPATTAQAVEATAAAIPLPPAKAGGPRPELAQTNTGALLALYRAYPLPLELSTKKMWLDSLNTDTLDTGVAIPDQLLKLFKARIHHVKGAEDVFALAQIPLANGAIGLATRVLNSDANGPGPYQVQLFVFDPRQHRIVTSCHIGEYITGSNQAFIREATLRQQPGGSLFIDIRQRTTGIDDDRGGENTGATSVTRRDSLVVYRLQNNRFQIVGRTELQAVYGHLSTLDEEE